jgi:hypothetical protein
LGVVVPSPSADGHFACSAFAGGLYPVVPRASTLMWRFAKDLLRHAKRR